MRLIRFSITAALLLATGCVAATAADPGVLEPDTADAETAPTAPEVDPEPTLEDRWRAPFAVISRGRTAPRPERAVVEIQPPAPDTGASAVAPADTAAAAQAVTAPDTAAVAAEGAGQAGEAAADEQPAAVDDEEAPGAESPRRTHRVEWGETWFGLARRYGVSTAALSAANPDVEPERLRAGEVILIPAPDPPAAGQRTHTVVVGDSLWGISRRYGVSIERIREANRLSDDRVRIGQVLVIP